jgi:hypothetical protein
MIKEAGRGCRNKKRNKVYVLELYLITVSSFVLRVVVDKKRVFW